MLTFGISVIRAMSAEADVTIRGAAGEILRRTGGDLPLAFAPQDRVPIQVLEDVDLAEESRLCDV